MKPRHVPLRTCTGCREERPKREMVRIVHTLDGSVRVDPSGKLSGRGAYICPRPSCWQTALKTGSLSRVLKTGLKEADLAELRQFAQTLTEPEPMQDSPSWETAMR